MTDKKIENLIGALSLALADDILRKAQSHIHVAAPAAAITLLTHVPGMTIDQLSRVLGLSHAGTVRLVDRLESENLLIRNRSSHDGRAVALILTQTGADLSRHILASRQNSLTEALASLSPSERETLGHLAEKMLRSLLKSEDHALEICRLCDPAICETCPVVDEISARNA